MNKPFKRLTAWLLAFAMVFTMLPLNAFAANGQADGIQKQRAITKITQKDGKQIVQLAKTRGQRTATAQRGVSLMRAGNTTNETVEQTINITLMTTGLGDEDFDWTAVGPSKSFTATIKVTDIANPSNVRTQDVIFSENKTQATITMTLPKNIGTRITAEIPVFENNISLRAYKDYDSTSKPTGTTLNFELGIMQLANPVINVLVTDPYGKNVNETIGQALAAKLIVGDNDYKFTIPASAKSYNVRNLEDLQGNDVVDLNDIGDSQSLVLTTALTDNKLKVGDTTYKYVNTTYDVNKGGLITFATQPTVITPQPGEDGNLPQTPEGYARVTFDPTAEGTIGSYDKGQKITYDVLKGTKWADAKKAGVAVPGNPTHSNPKMQFKGWETIPADEVTINNDLTITAKFVEPSDQDVIPYVPADPTNPTNPNDTNVPTKDKAGKTVDKSQYVIVAFKVDEAKGSLTLGDKTDQQVISALVKKGSTWDKVTAPTINVADANTKANGWNPAIPAGTETVENGKVYTAQFITNGQEITPGTKLPDDVFEVSVSRDETSVKTDSLYGKSYAVFKDSKLAQAKFPTPEAADKFKDAKWNVENPWDQAITKKTDFKASAISSVFDQDNITKIEIIQAPTKMTYTEGDKPKHDGIKVKLTDKNGNSVEVEKDQLGDYGVTVTPAETTDLTNADNNKPFVAKVNGKDADGKAKELTANTNKNITVNPKKSDQDVIPYVPANKENPTNPNDTNVPTKDKAGKTVDKSQYVIVAFKVDEAKGSLTLGDKTDQQVISALVKKGSTWDKVTAPTINVADANTKANGWNPAIPAGTETVENGKVYTAQFITNGQEITPGTKLPDDVFEVSVSRDETSVKTDSLYGKSYAVFKDSKLAQAKFPTPEAADKFKDAKWNVENPWDQAITKKTDFKASAISSVFDQDNITKIEIIQAPTKMTYTEGDKPKHDGIKVKLTDKNGNSVEVEKDQLGDYGVTVTPAETTDLTNADNNKPFVAKVNGKDADGKAKELTANTNKNITVNPKQADASEKPEVNPPYVGDEKITGKGVPGATIVVTDKNGDEIGKTKVKDDKTWEVTVPGAELLKKDEVIKVTQTEGNKRPASAEATVRAKTSSGGSSGGGSVIPSKPEPKPEKPSDGDLNKDDHYQYLIGYPDGTFAPNRGMTRAEVATMFTRLLKDRPVKGQSYAAGLSDVHTGDWYANTVGYAVQKGIVSGYPDGSFKPNQAITRAEFASIAARFANLTESKDLSFSDLDASHWGYKAIRLAASNGWISGYPDNTFRPEQAITRAEVTSITNRMLNRSADLDWINAHNDAVIHFSDVSAGDWFFEPVMEATMGHDFTRDKDGKAEHWTGLNDKTFI